MNKLLSFPSELSNFFFFFFKKKEKKKKKKKDRETLLLLENCMRHTCIRRGDQRQQASCHKNHKLNKASPTWLEKD